MTAPLWSKQEKMPNSEFVFGILNSLDIQPDPPHPTIILTSHSNTPENSTGEWNLPNDESKQLSRNSEELPEISDGVEHDRCGKLHKNGME